MDHNLNDILGPKRLSSQKNTNAEQKGEIFNGYGEEYNPDGSLSMKSSDWPEYQIKDTYPYRSIHHEGLDSTFPGNNGAGRFHNTGGEISPEISQAALYSNPIPGHKNYLSLGMNIGMDKPQDASQMSQFVEDVTSGKSMDKNLLSPAFGKPGAKGAGFRIPGEFSFKGDQKPLPDKQQEANFIKNFMSSRKNKIQRKKTQ